MSDSKGASDDEYKEDTFEDDVEADSHAAPPPLKAIQSKTAASETHRSTVPSSQAPARQSHSHTSGTQQQASSGRLDTYSASPAPPLQAVPVPQPHPRDTHRHTWGSAAGRTDNSSSNPSAAPYPPTTMHIPMGARSAAWGARAVPAPGPAASAPHRPFRAHSLHHYRVSIDLRSIRDLSDVYNIYARYSYPAFGSHAPVSTHPPVEVSCNASRGVGVACFVV